MFKLLSIVLATMLIAASYGLMAGGYADKPELIEDPTVKGLAVYAAEHLAMTQNIVLNNIEVTGVQTQVVAGMNYRIDFTGKTVNSPIAKTKSCQVVIYVRFNSTKKVTSAKCN
ncbi:unnamed protein product [Rotaria socialis]|uniref:Cystatin domain-containing protein n=1 Tax=Rotaria socialis TaxID=392032 RepID=A0A817L0T5_9BILA|nr:unnamed protein product [Rotaria socialis]CAF3371492.1 unnamed protein product [Rotaria socialis]CAF3379136.1 unnamed protein product [Rotaria socialis]CAF3447105.1 unnamed protein product [Rotaria socialis]CAF3601978.1 unnamed protein product [Rotaria socialis]